MRAGSIGGRCRNSSTRYAALAVPRGAPVGEPPAPVLVPDARESRRRRCERSICRATGRSRSCVPAPSSARRSAGPPSISRRWRSALAARRPCDLDRGLAQRRAGGRGARRRRWASAAPARARSHRAHRSRHGDRSDVGRVARRQQRFRTDACGCRRACAARRAVRIVVAGLHAAAVRQRRASRASRSRAAPASSANARSGIFDACANCRRSWSTIWRAHHRSPHRPLLPAERSPWPRLARRRSTRRRRTPRRRSTRRSRRATSTR